MKTTLPNLRLGWLLLLPLAIFAGCASAPSSRSGGSWPHLTDNGDSWSLDPGYDWNDPSDRNDLSVHWRPGMGYYQRHRLIWPHIVAGQAEGTWEPQPGYAWAHIENGQLQDYAVSWNRGSEYIVRGQLAQPNVLAAAEEGVWYPAPGYAWAHLDGAGNPVPGDLTVAWSPGRGYWMLGERKWPHVVADEKEGYWRAESGYEFLHPGTGDFATIASDDPHAPSAKEKVLEQRWVEYLQEIQAANNYANWSGPPADLYAARTSK